MPTYTPAASDATQDARAFPTKFQTRSYSVNPPNRVTAQWDLKPHSDELLALIAARVSSAAYSMTWTCASGLSVGAPVYISGNGAVALANATDATHAAVVGFVRFKPTTTSCLLDHFRLVTGDLDGTAGSPVYLTNSGVLSTTAGTIPAIIGTFRSVTEAVLFASPLPAPDGSITPAKLSETYSRWRGEVNSAPSSPRSGDMYFDTSTNHTFIYANSGWIQLD